MELTASLREKKGKNDKNRLRREKKIPAVIYKKGSSRSILVEYKEFDALLRKVPKGELSTQKLTLNLDEEKTQALVKDIQYNRTSYDVLHLDFLELDKQTLVTVNVPIRVTGEVQCPGLKLGGVVRLVMRTVKIRCLPDQIPAYFELNVAKLGLKQSKRVKEIPLPEGVRMLSAESEVVVLIAKR